MKRIGRFFVSVLGEFTATALIAILFLGGGFAATAGGIWALGWMVIHWLGVDAPQTHNGPDEIAVGCLVVGFMMIGGLSVFALWAAFKWLREKWRLSA